MFHYIGPSIIISWFWRLLTTNDEWWCNSDKGAITYYQWLDTSDVLPRFNYKI